MGKIDTGPQYNKDKPFKASARLHQSKFRAEELQLENYSEYGNRLCEDGARKGLNFYSDYNIFQLVKEFSNYSKKLYADMLRSEHIPWNMFLPFREEKELFKKVFSDLLEIDIRELIDIKIEYAPQPKEDYLNDATAFDVFADIKLESGRRFFLGIEIKYTEGSYPLKKGSKQERIVNDPGSIYYRVTGKSGSFIQEINPLLKKDSYRQIWRNYILAESLLMNSNNNYSDFISLTVYPGGNMHFTEKIEEFKEFMVPQRRYRLSGLTYKKLFDAMDRYVATDRARKWTAYLKRRYLVE